MGSPDPFRYVGGIRGRDTLGLESCVVGLSTGLLAAAVVALSPTIPALMPLAVEAVLIAFRLGLHVKTAASNIENSPAHGDDSSWSYVVPGKTKSEAQNALVDFHREQVTTVNFSLRQLGLTFSPRQSHSLIEHILRPLVPIP